MIVYKEKEIKVLKALAHYKYLTKKHFIALGIASTQQKLDERVLNRLRHGNDRLIKTSSISLERPFGRPPQIYTLTSHGASILAEYMDIDVSSISRPIGGVQFSRDMYHRDNFIYCWIALDQWAEKKGYQVNFFDAYYDCEGAQRLTEGRIRRKTSVFVDGRTRTPDGNFMLDMAGDKRLFTLELHRFTDTKKICEQLNIHARIITGDILTDKYKHQFSNYVLSIHTRKSTLQATKARLLQNAKFPDLKDHYVFNLVENVTACFKGPKLVHCGDFGKGWHFMDGEDFRLF